MSILNPIRSPWDREKNPGESSTRRQNIHNLEEWTPEKTGKTWKKPNGYVGETRAAALEHFEQTW